MKSQTLKYLSLTCLLTLTTLATAADTVFINSVNAAGVYDYSSTQVIDRLPNYAGQQRIIINFVNASGVRDGQHSTITIPANIHTSIPTLIIIPTNR